MKSSDEVNRMNEAHNFSVGPDVYKNISFPPEAYMKPNRYQYSWAAWQLARMGTFNLSNTIPLRIRLEKSGDIGELYSDGEQYVTLLDLTESNVLLSEPLIASLIRFGVRRLESGAPEKLRMLLITSFRSAESNPPELWKWEGADALSIRLEERLSSLSGDGLSLPEGENLRDFVRELLRSVSVRYQRRRNGRLGDERLWGFELDVLRVLQEAGVARPDLGAALKTLVAVVSQGAGDEDKKDDRVFSRRAARLLIRDYRRRARVDMPGVQLLDTGRVVSLWEPEIDIPRFPDWHRTIVSEGETAIERDCFDQALKWARRAAMTSGRGLLPVFFFVGESGSGRSFLLKQVAWELYRQGYAVAEITSLRDVAASAERLATGAVAVDSPLILVWDDPQGPGLNPVPFIRELAEAQVSGAPMVLLAAAQDETYDSKALRRISRTAFEEFTVHATSPQERKRLAELPAVQEGNECADDVNILWAWIRIAKGQDAEAFAAATWESIKTAAGERLPAAEKILLLGASGIPLPKDLLDSVMGKDTLDTLHERFRSNPFFQVVPARGAWERERPQVDFLHRDIMKTIAQLIPEREAKSEETFKAVAEKAVLHEKHQEWLVRMLRYTSGSEAYQSVRSGMIDVLQKGLTSEAIPFSTDVLKDLFDLFGGSEGELRSRIIAALERNARSGGVAAFAALPPLLRNNLGHITTEDVLMALEAAKPSMDRSAFKFLLKYLGNHLPNDQREAVVESARTAAARDPDDGYAIAAYLKLVWSRGSDAQVERAVRETETWLESSPDDRVVRRAFLDYVLKQEDIELKRRTVESVEAWLEQHPDEGILRKGFIELVSGLGDRQLMDRVLDKTAEWIEKWGNNRAVRNMYFRRVEKRGDEKMMRRACEVAANWMEHHPDDRETQRSLIFLALRAEDEPLADRALALAFRWMKHHPVEAELLGHYMYLADKYGNPERIREVVEIALKYVSDHPEDEVIREKLLGIAAKKLDRKEQLKVYNINTDWLSNQAEPKPMVEYLAGRLGVRAGIARRAIPLLERSAARDDFPLQNHARLWLGSAYRVAEAYRDARAVWEKVMKDENPDMQARAEKNIAGLEAFLQKKYPEGFPPQPPPPPRRFRKPDRKYTSTESSVSPERQPRREPRRFDRIKQDRMKQTERTPGKQTPGKPPAKQQRERRKDNVRPMNGQPQQKAGRYAATLGDILKLQGLDLKAHFGGKKETRKRKRKENK